VQREQEVGLLHDLPAVQVKVGEVQKMLSASTSTKNAAYPKLMYIESLIGPDTVDTIPPATYEAFKAHGTARVTLTENLAEAREVLTGLAEESVELDEVTAGLLDEGVQKFEQAFVKLLASVEQSVRPASIHAGTLYGSLPRELEAAVDTLVEEWSEGRRVARLWAHDAALWTGADEGGWLGWLGVTMDQLTHAHRFAALADDIRFDPPMSSSTARSKPAGSGLSLCGPSLRRSARARPLLERIRQLRRRPPRASRAGTAREISVGDSPPDSSWRAGGQAPVLGRPHRPPPPGRGCVERPRPEPCPAAPRRMRAAPA
jgi:transaldolase/fructose-6-phosphate aldolase-like protein